MIHKFISILFFSLFFLAGCAKLGFEKDNTPKPTPLANFQPELSVRSLWSLNTGSGTGKNYLNLKPAVYDTAIYSVATNGQVNAANTHSGKLLWRTQLKLPISAGAGVNEDTVAIVSSNADVLALERDSGKVRWHKLASNEILTAPVIAENIILIKTIDGKIEAYDSYKGDVLWTYEHGAPSLILRASSSPAVQDNTVIAGFSDGKVTTFSLKDARLIWERPVALPAGATVIDQMVDIDSDPIIKEHVIYVVTYQGKVAALELKTGQILWQHDFSSYTGIAISNGAVFATDAEGNVWAFDQQNGSVLWKQAHLKHRWLTAPAANSNYVIVADGEGYIHWLDTQDGHFIARNKVDSAGIIATPLIINGIAYIQSKSGQLVALQTNKLS